MSTQQQEPESQAKTPEVQQPRPEPSRNWGQQILGGLIGAFAGYSISGIVGELGWRVGERYRWLLWGALLGSLLGSWETLSRAGARLTGKSNRLLNTAVAILGMVVVFGVLLGLGYLASRILAGLLG